MGDINTDGSLGAGLSDTCAGCHVRPRGAAGFGGDVFTGPDSRDAPHLFGLRQVEMLADEITSDSRSIKDNAVQQSLNINANVTAKLISKGISYSEITVRPDGSADTSKVVDVNTDLRVRPFFAQGGTISIREFFVGAFNAEIGTERSKRRYKRLRESGQRAIQAYLGSLILFPPDDTASNLNPGDPAAVNFPQNGHGNIKLPVLFNDPTDLE